MRRILLIASFRVRGKAVDSIQSDWGNSHFTYRGVYTLVENDQAASKAKGRYRRIEYTHGGYGN